MTPIVQEERSEPIGVLCARCEYDIRGLARDGRCPECGADLESSWRRAEQQQHRVALPLHLSSRQWLKWMAIGCALLIAAAIATVADAAFMVQVTRNDWLGAATGLMQMGFGVAGLWMLGSREPATATIAN